MTKQKQQERKKKRVEEDADSVGHVLLSRELWDLMFDNGYVRPTSVHRFAPEKDDD